MTWQISFQNSGAMSPWSSYLTCLPKFPYHLWFKNIWFKSFFQSKFLSFNICNQFTIYTIQFIPYQSMTSLMVVTMAEKQVQPRVRAQKIVAGCFMSFEQTFT